MFFVFLVVLELSLDFRGQRSGRKEDARKENGRQAAKRNLGTLINADNR